MASVTDPAAAPAYVLNTLHSAGYEPYAVDGAPDQWRIPGQPPKPWRQCMEDIGIGFTMLRGALGNLQHDYSSLQLHNKALADENRLLTDQNIKLSDITPKTGLLSSRFVATFFTAVPMMIGTVFVVLQDTATNIFPAPWGKVIAGVAALLVGGMTKNFVGGRSAVEEEALAAKKALVAAQQAKQGEKQ